MNCKNYIVPIDSASVANIWVYCTLEGVERVKVEANWVEHGEFDGEAGAVLGGVVHDGLWVEAQ